MSGIIQFVNTQKMNYISFVNLILHVIYFPSGEYEGDVSIEVCHQPLDGFSAENVMDHSSESQMEHNSIFLHFWLLLSIFYHYKSTGN